MNVIQSQQHSQRTDDKVIKIAIMAVGGQGGGVLTSWIEALGRAKGYEVQATSVAGVSQRTGATIYYIEICLLYTSPSPRDLSTSRMPSSA